MRAICKLVGMYLQKCLFYPLYTFYKQTCLSNTCGYGYTKKEEKPRILSI